ncbi:MAG TPA: hypothetical protein VMF32_22295 [Xanthobacteraceae bacterium]|nr:hypothetical protein [Xanthobacteraceae bacterium]HTV31772.1 hypothetical protein [Methylocella sp.]HUO01033.1 hypothetical protein [Bradyrhizobium sp.]
MSWFVTRVELHDASRSDYTQLHEAMRKQGFTLDIVGSDGTRYSLPPAEYYYDGTVSRGDVIGKAKKAAESVKTPFAVIVTEALGSTWYGLKVV